MSKLWSLIACLFGGIAASLGILALQRGERRRAVSAARQRAEAERLRKAATLEVQVNEARAEAMATDDRAELARMLDE